MLDVLLSIDIFLYKCGSNAESCYQIKKLITSNLTPLLKLYQSGKMTFGKVSTSI